METRYDAVIVGGGPAGLSAALVLGRARQRVLLLDAGTPRNARAHGVQGFVTRDGIAPVEFRRIAREQLAAYPTVEVVGERIEGVTGELDAFRVALGNGAVVRARRIVLAMGMVDVLPDLPGFREFWGVSLFQCPYCHGWEVRDKAFGFLAPGPEALEFAGLLQAWSKDVVVFTGGRFAVPAHARRTDIVIEERPVRALVAGPEGLEAVELSDGTRVSREVLFVRPPQRQVALVEALGLALDPMGFVQVDGRQETSRRGIYAAGDMTMPLQAAIAAAAAGHKTAAMVNHDLMVGPAPLPKNA